LLGADRQQARHRADELLGLFELTPTPICPLACVPVACAQA